MNFKILSKALLTCNKSNFYKHQMGCVVFQGKRVIETGCNLALGSGRATLHAEANAIEKLARRHGLLRHLRSLLTKKYSLKTCSHSQYRKCRNL